MKTVFVIQNKVINKEEPTLLQLAQYERKCFMNSKIIVAFFSLLAIVCSSCTSVKHDTEKTITLVKNNQAKATIIIAKKATKSARFAAFELQNHIELITGVKLPIVKENVNVKNLRILVGESIATRKLGLDEKELKGQQYLIKFFPKTIILMGKDKKDFGNFEYDYMKGTGTRNWPDIYDAKGSMDAVYDFLQQYCAVKWINRSDYGTILPKKATLKVAVKDHKREPFLKYRGMSNSYFYQKNGGLWNDHTKGAKAYNEQAYAQIYKKFGSSHKGKDAIKACKRLQQYRMKAGGEKVYCNHSLAGFYQTFYDKKHKDFKEFKIDYFAKGYEGLPPQLCYSNPATIKQVVKDVRDYFDNGGHRKLMPGVGTIGYTWGENTYALEPMDNKAFCKCENCSKDYDFSRQKDSAEHSDYWFQFVNKVAKEIKKTHPNKQIATLAYMSHEGLPEFKLENNVVVFFCLSANRLPYLSLLDKQIRRLKEWRKKSNNDIYLWLYHTFPLERAYHGKFHAFPGNFAHTLKKQFDLFKQLNIKGIFHCGFNGFVENYITFALMDNPDLSIDKLLDDYFSSYGKAGVEIRKFYEFIEERYSNKKYYPKGVGHQNARIAWKYLGNEKTMKQLQKYMDKAYELTETKQQRTLVELWDKAIWQYMKQGRKHYLERTSALIPEFSAPKVNKAHGKAKKINWKKIADLGGKWYNVNSGKLTTYKMSGKICHDGEYLYMKLSNYGNPKDLRISPTIASFDDWEIYAGTKRAQPFRQYLIGPTAMTAGLSYGEVNWRQGVIAKDYTTKAFGLIASSDTSSKDKWITYLAFPLEQMASKPLKSGDNAYLNIIRVRKGIKTRFLVETLVPYTTVKEADRFAKIYLEK